MLEWTCALYVQSDFSPIQDIGRVDGRGKDTLKSTRSAHHIDTFPKCAKGLLRECNRKIGEDVAMHKNCHCFVVKNCSN